MKTPNLSFLLGVRRTVGVSPTCWLLPGPRFTSCLLLAITLILLVVKRGVLGASSHLAESLACSAKLALLDFFPSYSASLLREFSHRFLGACQSFSCCTLGPHFLSGHSLHLSLLIKTAASGFSTALVATPSGGFSLSTSVSTLLV